MATGSIPSYLIPSSGSEDSDSDSTSSRCIRITALLYRKPDTSKEFFHRYWAEKHGPLVSDFFARNGGIAEYRQHHITPTAETLSLVASLAPRPTLDADGIAEVYLRDWSTYTTILQSEEFRTKIMPDEENFLDRERMTVTIGWDYVAFKGVQEQGKEGQGGEGGGRGNGNGKGGGGRGRVVKTQVAGVQTGEGAQAGVQAGVQTGDEEG